MANTIYDYWFVQFDFPDKDRRPYKSSGGKMVWNEQVKREIPESWEVVSLNRLCSISTSQCVPSLLNCDFVEHYSIPAFDADVFPAFDTPKSILSNKFCIPKSAILYSKLNAQIKRIWDPLFLTNTPIASSEFVVYLPKAASYRGFIYAVLNSQKFFRFANSISSSSTGSRKRFSPECTKGFKVERPPEELLVDFSDLYSSILASIRNARIEIDSLKKQRDFVLPLLMNGQVVVA